MPPGAWSPGATTPSSTRNPATLRALLDTTGTSLVEASATDRIWGIGLAAEAPRALSRATWRGRNRLGEVLTDIRGTLLAARSAA